MENSWSYMPDLCLLAVFKYIPVSDMIRSVGRVCINWARVQRDELRCRSTLVIIETNDDFEERLLEELTEQENPYGSAMIEHVRCDDGSPWARSIHQIGFHALRVHNGLLSEGHTTALMDLMPNITHLIMNFNIFNVSQIILLEQMTRLINHYATSLISLKLTFRCFFRTQTTSDDSNYASTKIAHLVDSINRLESLRHLMLNFYTTGIDYRNLELTILSRLCTFTCKSFDLEPWLLASLRKYATGDVRVECEELMSFNVNSLVETLEPQLAAKFTRVNLSLFQLLENPDHFESMRLFCSRFVSVTSLSLFAISTPMTTLARSLSQLTELIHFKLNIREIPKDEQTPEHEPPQVASVRLLTLTVHTQSHHDT